MSQEDLRRRNRELRHNIIVRKQEQLQKDIVKKQQDILKAELIANAPKNTYPELILTMNKRLARIDPWNGVANLNIRIAVLVNYYKLRQLGMEKLRIVANAAHAWVEFYYNNVWWIFDLATIKKRTLGLPVKRKTGVDAPEYTTLSRSFDNVDDYIEIYGDEIYLTKDECKILAMRDIGLGAITNINYF